LPDAFGHRKDVLLGRYGTKKSRVDYARVIAEWEANGRRLPAAKVSEPTIAELANAFWQHVQEHYRRLDGSLTNEVFEYRQSAKKVGAVFPPFSAEEMGRARPSGRYTKPAGGYAPNQAAWPRPLCGRTRPVAASCRPLDRWKPPPPRSESCPEKIDHIMDPERRNIMPQGNPTARVFIWYPHRDFQTYCGHASLYIGNYEVGKNFELALDPNAPDFVRVEERDPGLGEAGVYYNDNYVSWWPKGQGSPTERCLARPQLGLYKDVKAEHCEPHIIYDLYGLNVGAMKACWRETRGKLGATYQFMRKNCATIVLKVLEAGGALNKIGKLDSLWFGNRLYWTPKRVAQICDKLRDKDLAVKDKARHCPAKGDFLPSALEALTGTH
jgi:hypothetical protein